MSTISEKEDIATCPYNPSHKIAKFKLLPHVHRCKDGLKSTKKLYHCKRDSLIMFFADKKETHLQECQYCYNIYNNVGKDQSTLNDISLNKIKKKPNYNNEEKSISYINVNQNVINFDNDNVTINLNPEEFEMINLNNSVISMPSMFGNQENKINSLKNKEDNAIKQIYENKESNQIRNNKEKGNVFFVRDSFSDISQNMNENSSNNNNKKLEKNLNNYIHHNTEINSEEADGEDNLDDTFNLSQYSRKI